MKKLRSCKVCKKEIEVKIQKTMGGHGKNSDNTTFTYSDEGILFKYKKGYYWFCNDCWKEMFKNYIKWKNKSI